ncbi:MAG: hypothetical protein AAB926_01580 [Patescibacteria group bacterium]
MKKEKSRKLVCGFLGIMLILPLLFLTRPQKTEAFITLTKEVPGPLLVMTGTIAASTADTAVNTSVLAAKETIADSIAYTIGKVLLRQFTDSIVQWINSGFEGKPLFVTNFGAYLQEAADQASGVLMEQIFSADFLATICSPFRLQLPISIAFSRKVPYDIKMRCTLNDVVGNFEGAIEDFQDDFMSGGWPAFVSMSQNFQNNPYGAYLTTLDEIEQAREEAKEKAEKEYTAGKGFIGVRTCVATTAGGICARYETKTPGSAIADALGNGAFGTTFRELEVADEIDEIIAASLNQLISYALGPGAGPNRGVADYQSSGISLPDSLRSENADTQKLGNLIIRQQDYLDLKESSRITVNAVLPILESIQNCSSGNYIQELSDMQDKKTELDSQIQQGQALLNQMYDISAERESILTQILNTNNAQTLNRLTNQLSEMYYDINYGLPSEVGSPTEAEREATELSLKKTEFLNIQKTCRGTAL